MRFHIHQIQVHLSKPPKKPPPPPFFSVPFPSQVPLATSPCRYSFCGCVSVRCRRARGPRWCPSRPLPPRETSGRRSRCEAWSSPAWGPWAPRPGTGPRRSPVPRPGASWALGCRSWPRSEPWLGMFGWGSPGAGLWRKTSSGASPAPPGSPSGDPAREHNEVCHGELVSGSVLCIPHLSSSAVIAFRCHLALYLQQGQTFIELLFHFGALWRPGSQELIP